MKDFRDEYGNDWDRVRLRFERLEATVNQLLAVVRENFWDRVRGLNPRESAIALERQLPDPLEKETPCPPTK